MNAVSMRVLQDRSRDGAEIGACLYSEVHR